MAGWQVGARQAVAGWHASGVVMDTTSFLHPIDVGEFRGKYLGARHLVIPGPDDKFAALFDWKAVDLFIRMNGLHPSRCSLVKGKEQAPFRVDAGHVHERSGQRYGRINIESFATALREGYTLVLNHVDLFHPPLEALLRSLESALLGYVRANVYLSFQSDASAFGPHWDAHDVFVVQVAGIKRWQIWERTWDVPLDHESDSPVRPSRIEEELELTAGDVLYLPRGVWHDVRAAGTLSLHVAASIRNRTGMDFLSWALRRCRTHALIRSDIPRFGDTPLLQDYIADVRSVAESYVSEAGLARFLAEQQGAVPPRARFMLPWLVSGRVEDFDLNCEISHAAGRLRLEREGAGGFLVLYHFHFPVYIH